MKTQNFNEIAAKVAAMFTVTGVIAFTYYVLFVWIGNAC